MAVRDWPPPVVCNRTLAAAYRHLGSCGEKKIGKLWNPYPTSSAACPIGLSCQTLMSRVSWVRW
jgi:hypothetical protein